MTASGWLRAFWVLAPVASVFACDRPGWELSSTAPVATAGSASIAGFSAGGEPCKLDGSVGPSPIFAGQTVLNNSPARSELYMYVDDAEAQRLRSSGTLLPQPVGNAGSGGQSAVQVRLNQLQIGATPAERTLISSLVQRFQSARTTWPNLFALRLLEHPGTEHMNPVRIVLRPDAWIGRLDKSFTVVDVKNQPISSAQAQASPERIAAIFVLLAPEVTVSVTCDRGSREMALGNEAMVESWSLATQEISDRLDSDIASLTALFDVARPCSSVDRGNSTFQAFTVCTTWPTFGALSEYAAYGFSLAKPSELYKPSAQNLVSLIDALDRDRFELDPFVVRPEPAIAGGAGAGGAGGESAGGAGGAP